MDVMNGDKPQASKIISAYRTQYRILAPDNDSLQLTKAAWSNWEKAGVVPPDIDTIAREHIRFENGFFYDIVSVAERVAGEDLLIQYCAFCLDSYSFYAFSADDGYVVLVDDSFFQLLFFLSNILIFQAQGLIKFSEREAVKQLIADVIANNYFNRRQFDFSQNSLFSDLLQRDYALTEFANYLFHGLKIFIVAHEIGHHLLGHTKGHVRRVFSANQQQEAIFVDQRSIAGEYEADRYGYQLFQTVCSTVDGSIPYAYCQYRFDFAPLFLFDVFARLDGLKKAWTKKPINYQTHPAPHKRAEALRSVFAIDYQDPLYLALKKALQLIPLKHGAL